MPDIKKYSTGRLGNHWGRHENTDHENTKGLDKDGLPGIEGYIDEDIVRAYDDNRPIKNLLANDELAARASDKFAESKSIDAFYKNNKEDWAVEIESNSVFVDPSNFAKRITTTPLIINSGTSIGSNSGLSSNGFKQLVGVERNDKTILWFSPHEWNYSETHTIDDPNASYTGYYKPIYSDVSESTAPSDYENFALTVRQRFSTGAVYTYRVFIDGEMVVPYSSSIFETPNELVDFSAANNYPGYDLFPNTFYQLESNNLGLLEIGEDTSASKNIRREEHKILANELSPEAGAFKAKLQSDVFRANKSAITGKIENEPNFIRAINGVRYYNNTGRIYFNQHNNQSGVLVPLEDSKEFLGDTEYSFDIQIANKKETIRVNSPETRAYQDLPINTISRNAVVTNTSGLTTYNFYVQINTEVGTATQTLVTVEVDDPNLYVLRDAINVGFENANVYAAAEIRNNGGLYFIRLYSRSSGDYSNINITNGPSDLASNLGISYGTPVPGRTNWYIYYDPLSPVPGEPAPDLYVARRVSGTTPRNDFDTSVNPDNVGYQIFEKMVNAGFDNFEVGIDTSISATHTTELYISDFNAVQGYINLSMSVPDPNQESGLDSLKEYYFQLNVDNKGFKEYSFTTTTDTTYAGVLNSINSILVGEAVISIETNSEVRITSDSYGPQSVVDTDIGLSGDNFFGTGYPAAGFTPVSAHQPPIFGKGRRVNVTPRQRNAFTVFQDAEEKRVVFSYDDDILHITPNSKTDKKDHVDTLHAWQSRNSNGKPEERWSTHNDKTIEIDMSLHASWIPGSTVTQLETITVSGFGDYLIVGNSSGQVYFISDNSSLYKENFDVNQFELMTDSAFNSLTSESINKAFVYRDGVNSLQYLFILTDEHILHTEISSGIAAGASFTDINTSSSLSIPNVSDNVFSKIRNITDWRANVDSAISNNYLIAVGDSASNSTWNGAPIVYALYDTSTMSFSWYAEEVYQKTQIDLIADIVKFDGWTDPEQSNQIFIASNINGPELWAGNSQNNDSDLGGPGDDKFNRFSWVETNFESGQNALEIDQDLERINFLKVFDEKIFIGGKRKNNSIYGGLYSYSLNSVQRYFDIDCYQSFYDELDDVLYLTTSEGEDSNSDPSVLKISQETEEGRAQIISDSALTTVANWPASSAFRVLLNGFVVGGVNFDGEYNIEFNGQGKINLSQLVDEINGASGAGFEAAIDVDTGIANDITPVIRAREIVGYEKVGTTYSPVYKLAIESKIPDDLGAGHSTTFDTTRSNCSIELLHPTIGTTIVGTGPDTIEVDSETIGYANLQLQDWQDAEAYQLKRKSTNQISFSGNTFISISPLVEPGYEILSGSLRVKTNATDELGFSQGRGQILKTNTPTGLPNDSTTFGMKVTIDENVGPAGTPEITEVTFPADSLGSLGGTYWTIGSSLTTSPWEQYYIWYNVDEGNTDPMPAIPNSKGLEVKLESSATASEVAQDTVEVLNETPDFSINLVSNLATIETIGPGNITDATDVTTGVTINVTQQGADPGYTVSWVNFEGSNAQTVWNLVGVIDSDLIGGTASLQNIAATSEYCDIVITSSTVGSNSTVRIEPDFVSGSVNLIGPNGIDVIPNTSISGSTALNTPGTQTLGYTWENADYFYVPEHPDTSDKRIYIPNGSTRVDPGATIWLNFWEWRKLTKIPAKDPSGTTNNVPVPGEWTFDLEEKKVVVGEDLEKTFPQDYLYVDVKVAKELIKLDLSDNPPGNQTDLSDRFHLSAPYNIENSDYALARTLSRLIALDYGAKLSTTDNEDPIRANYSFFLPRLDIYSFRKESNVYGSRIIPISGQADPTLPFVEMPLVDQDKDAYLYTAYVGSLDYKDNNITEVPWYSSDNLSSHALYLSGSTQYFKPEDELVSSRGLAPNRDSKRTGKTTVNDLYSLVVATDPIGIQDHRKRRTNIREIDSYNAIFVDPNSGNDLNPGTSRVLPLETIDAAVSQATKQRNNIIILKANDKSIPTFGRLTVNRSFHINIYAEYIVRVEGLDVQGSLYIEGVDLSVQTGGGNADVTLKPGHNFMAKYCNFNTIFTEASGIYEGINVEIYNSIFETEAIHVEDSGQNVLDIQGKIDVQLNYSYIKTAEIAYFWPWQYNESVENRFEFNNVTNGLYESGYIIDTPKSNSLAFEFNRSLLCSGSSTNFASSAPITLNECLTYNVGNNELYGTGSVLLNSTNNVTPGDIDIITETGAPVSIARGYNKDSAAINYVQNSYDAGAYLEHRFEDTAKNNESSGDEKSVFIFDEKRVQYKYNLNPEKFTFYIRFKPQGNFQQQGVIFDSRYDGDFDVSSSVFGSNGSDFVQIAYNNKTYNLNYLSDTRYSFKLIMSNSDTIQVAEIGPGYTIDDFNEFNNWHEIAVLIENTKTKNPKYSSADLSSDYDRTRRQTLIYTVFDRWFDRVYGLRSTPSSDSSGTEILDSTWKPGRVLSKYFNVGGGWSADWVQTAQGFGWSVWSESSFNMLVDEFLVSQEKIPVNILTQLGEKRVIDLKRNDYKTSLADDKTTVLLSHCDNSHPFSENGIEPFDDYFINFRPYEGYESHAISIEDSSANLVPYGRIEVGQWFDRDNSITWSPDDIEILDATSGDIENNVLVLGNYSGDFIAYYVDKTNGTITDQVTIASDEAFEASLKEAGNKYIITFVDSSDSRPYFKTLERTTHVVGPARLINNNVSDYISFTLSPDQTRIAVLYHEGSNGYAVIREISSGNLVHGPVEFADNVDIRNTSIGATVDQDGNNSYLLFFHEASNGDLKFVMYDETLSTIILSHTTLAAGQNPVSLKAYVLESNNTLIKWKNLNVGADSDLKIAAISPDGAQIISETDIFNTTSDDDYTEDILRLKDGNLLFASLNRSTQEVEYKLYSQSGEELDSSQYLRNYTEQSVDSVFLAYPNSSPDIETIIKSNNECFIINLDTSIPRRWYKDTTGVYDSFKAVTFPTKTEYGNGLHVKFNHTTSSGEQGVYVADAETQDLLDFDGATETNGTITTNTQSQHHGSYGYEVKFDGLGSTLYAEKNGFTTTQNETYARFYIELDKFFSLSGPNPRRLEIARFGPSTDPLVLELELNDPLSGGDGKYKLRAHTNSFGDETTTNSVIDYSASQYVDVYWNNASSGGWEVWVDGNSVLSQTGQNTTAEGNADYISIGSQSSLATPAIDSTLRIDDIRVDTSFIGEYTAGLGQGTAWTTSEISQAGDQHYISGYNYIVSGDWILRIDGPALDLPIEIQFSESGTYSHLSYNNDSVNDIKVNPINWNGVYRFAISFTPDNNDTINIRTRSLNSDDDLRIDEFLVDNIKLEQNEYASSIEANSTGYLSYPAALQRKGSAFFRIYPQFSWNTNKDKSFLSAASTNESGNIYVTHEVYYDSNDNKFKLRLNGAQGNYIVVESNEYGPIGSSRLNTDLNERHTIIANWDVDNEIYELIIDDDIYKLEGASIPGFKIGAISYIGNRLDKSSASNSLFDLIRVSDEPLTRKEILILRNKINPFQRNNKTNIGNVTVKGLSFYGTHESDKATIYSERNGENSSLVLDIGDDFEDKIVIRHTGEELAFFNKGGFTINGALNAALLNIQATTTMASYDDHVTVRYGFTGTPPEYNDGYFEVERGNLTNAELRFDESQDSWVIHDGSNKSISIGGDKIGTWKDDDPFNLVSNGTGAINLSTNSTTDAGIGDGSQNRTVGINRLRITPDETIVNDPGNDHDFRVESLGGGSPRHRESTHMLFVDASENQVLIGRNTSDSTSGALVVNYKTTIQSQNNTSFGTVEFLNNNGDRSGFIGDGNGSNSWSIVSEINTLRLEGIDFDVILSGTTTNSFNLEVAGGARFDINGVGQNVEWDIESTQINSWLVSTQGGVQWNLSSTAQNAEFEIDIASPSNRSFNLATAGGVRFDINGTTTTAGAEDKFKVEIANTVSSSFHIDTLGGALFDVDNGFRVNENANGAYFELDDSGKFKAHTNNTAADSIFFDTLGSVNITASGLFDVNANSGINISENSGAFLDVSTSGLVELHAMVDLDLTTDSGSSMAIAQSGRISAESFNGSTFEMNTDGKINLSSANLANADVTITANNSGDIRLIAANSNITTTADSTIVNTDSLIIRNEASNETLISASANGNVTLFYDNSSKFNTTSTGAYVDKVLTVGSISTGSQSTTQAGSSFNGNGFLETAWVYSSSMQAPSERNTAYTGLFMGAGNGVTNADEIILSTQGAIGLKVTNATDVEVENNLLVKDNLTVYGSFQFDTGTGVITIDNIVEQLGSPSPTDTLITESAVINYVEANYGQVFGTDGDNITLEALNGDELDRVIAPYAVDAGNLRRTVTAGTLLTGGGSLDGQNITVNHASVTRTDPSNATSSNGEAIVSVTSSTQGHVTAVQKYDFDTRYYTKTNLSTSGLSTVHWDNLSNVPTYDNYVNWRIAANGTSGSDTVTSGDTMTISGGSQISATRSGDTVTISHANTSSQGDINTSGSTVIDRIYIDGNGHVTSMATRTISVPIGNNTITTSKIKTSAYTSSGSIYSNDGDPGYFSDFTLGGSNTWTFQPRMTVAITRNDDGYRLWFDSSIGAGDGDIKNSSGSPTHYAHANSVVMRGQSSDDAGANVSIYKRYVTSSGEIYWIMALKDKKANKIIRVAEAPDHPSFGSDYIYRDSAIRHTFFENYENDENYEIIVANPSLEFIKNVEKDVESEKKKEKPKYDTISGAIMFGDNYSFEEIKTPMWPDKNGAPDYYPEPITIGVGDIANFPFSQPEEEIEIFKKRVYKPNFVKVMKLVKKQDV